MKNEILNYRVINTQLQDLDKIYWLYQEAIKYQRKNGFVGWSQIDKTFIEKEIKNQLHYKIVQEKTIVCVFAISDFDPFIWGNRDEPSSLYLHRVVVHPEFRGRKYFSKIMNWLIEYALLNKIKSIRMDTWATNSKLRKFYQNYGFKIIDNITTSNTAELPQQHRNLDVTLLEYRL